MNARTSEGQGPYCRVRNGSRCFGKPSETTRTHRALVFDAINRIVRLMLGPSVVGPVVVATSSLIVSEPVDELIRWLGPATAG